MIDNKQLSIIIVNYRSETYLEKCLASIFKQIKTPTFEVIIVNNDKQSKLAKIRNIYQNNLTIINERNNKGFGAANNQGAKVAFGEILLFLNPDTEILNGNLEVILKEFKEKKEVAVIGSRLIDEKNQTQEWIVGKETTLWQIIRNNLGFAASRTILKKNKKMIVETVSGAGMFIRKEAFQKIKGFDENLFLYYEDEDLCKRIWLAGYKIVYLPEFIVRHFGGKSMANKEEQKKEFYKSQDYYFQKHRGMVETIFLKILRKISG